MTLLDLLLAAILTASIVSGVVTGFTRATLGIVATVLGVILGFWLYDLPAGFFARWVGPGMSANLFGFFTVLLIVLAIGAIVARIVSTLFKAIGLGLLDRLGGALFGFFRGALICAAAVAILLSATPRPIPSWMRGSTLLPYAITVADLTSALAPRALKDAVADSIAEIRKAWNEEIQRAKRRAQQSLKEEEDSK